MVKNGKSRKLTAEIGSLIHSKKWYDRQLTTSVSVINYLFEPALLSGLVVRCSRGWCYLPFAFLAICIFIISLLMFVRLCV